MNEIGQFHNERFVLVGLHMVYNHIFVPFWIKYKPFNNVQGFQNL